MSKGQDEVEAAVQPVVHNVPMVQAALVVQALLELLVNVGDDGLEAVPTVDGVTIARYVYHCQLQLDPSLFNLNSRSLNLDGSFDFLCSSRYDYFWVGIQEE